MAKKIGWICLIAVVAVAAVMLASTLYYSVFFPLKYESEVKIFSQKYSLETELVFSVINAESGFRAGAESDRGALGLMQLMPSTALWAADKVGLKDFTVADLKKPEINIELGCYYLRYLSDKFESTQAALAAYNAGEGTVRQWLLQKQYSEDAKTLTNVPYRETRRYIEKITKSKHVYSTYYKNKLAKL